MNCNIHIYQVITFKFEATTALAVIVRVLTTTFSGVSVTVTAVLVVLTVVVLTVVAVIVLTGGSNSSSRTSSVGSNSSSSSGGASTCSPVQLGGLVFLCWSVLSLSAVVKELPSHWLDTIFLFILTFRFEVSKL